MAKKLRIIITADVFLTAQRTEAGDSKHKVLLQVRVSPFPPCKLRRSPESPNTCKIECTHHKSTLCIFVPRSVALQDFPAAGFLLIELSVQ